MLVKLGMSIAALAVVVAVVGPRHLVEALGALSLPVWAAGLAAFLGLHAASALKWRLFLGLCGVSLSRGAALRCYAAGLFANLCLPSLVGGDVLRAGLAMGATGNKAGVVLGSLVDRLADVLALALLVGLGALAAPGALPRVRDGTLDATWIVGGVAMLGLGGTVLGLATLRRIVARRRPRKVARLALGAVRAGRTLRGRPVAALAGLLACLGLQAGFVVINMGLGRAMQLELDARLWFLLWPLAKIAAMAPLSLGGLGVREAAFGVLVEPFADSRVAVAESLVWESILVAGGLLAGAWWMGTRRAGRGRPS